MNVSVEDKKIEAIKRMKDIGIYSQTIDQFKEGYLSQSEPPFGACFWVEGEQLERVKEFEKEHNALVYFVIHSYSNLGETEEYLYVCDYEEEWEIDRDDLENGTPLAYVYIKDNPIFSEIGTIGIELTPAAGLKRTA